MQVPRPKKPKSIIRQCEDYARGRKVRSSYIDRIISESLEVSNVAITAVSVRESRDKART